MKKTSIIIIVVIALLNLAGCSSTTTYKDKVDLSYLKTPKHMIIISKEQKDERDRISKELVNVIEKLNDSQTLSKNEVKKLKKDQNQLMKAYENLENTYLIIDDTIFIEEVFYKIMNSKASIVKNTRSIDFIKSNYYTIELSYEDIPSTRQNLLEGYLDVFWIFQDGRVIVPKNEENFTEDKLIEARIDFDWFQEKIQNN
ncbi:hypothetical protein SAMN05446037_10642 [Anaerovirgula multivorans]|uniref:Uncharacterized protein n=1 Tax=Anaerovirgula multivorans TaxID=312168 RepID=A0A239L5G9_9FIRM|nr:hypothetical protein [Anaerovirgula multivorans]SNT25691.1 hypothetical protein SAMN05446037_10642 [Anaerovirgula multivorans]